MELENQNLDSEFDIFAFKPSPKHSPVGSISSVMDSTPLSHAGPPHTPARTPAPHTPSMARTPGAPHTPGTAHTPAAAATTPATAHTPQPSVHSPRILQPAHQPTTAQPATLPEQNIKRSLKHLCYVNHFPITQDEFSAHETNQRMLILYGVAKERDEITHSVKKIVKEVQKLYQRKNCIDVIAGEVRKKEKKKDKERDSEGSLESTFSKFRKLSYFDQHAVTQRCAPLVVDLLTSFTSGSSVCLPVIDNISFLLNLMENALNIAGLLDFAVLVSKFSF